MELALRDPQKRVASADKPFTALHYADTGPPMECQVLCIVGSQVIIRERSPECDDDGMPLNWTIVYEVPLSQLALLSDFERLKHTSTMLMPTGIRTMITSHKMLDYFDTQAKLFPGIQKERLEHIKENLKKEISLHYAASENRTSHRAFYYEDPELVWYEKYLSYYNGKQFENDTEVINAACLLNHPLRIYEDYDMPHSFEFDSIKGKLSAAICFQPKWLSVVEEAVMCIYTAFEHLFATEQCMASIVEQINRILKKLDHAQAEDKEISYKFEVYKDQFTSLMRNVTTEKCQTKELAIIQLELMPFLCFCLSFELSIEVNFMHDQKYCFILITRRFESKLCLLLEELREELISETVCGSWFEKARINAKIAELQRISIIGTTQAKQRSEEMDELEQSLRSLEIQPEKQSFITMYAHNGESAKYRLDLRLIGEKIVYEQNMSELEAENQQKLAFSCEILSNLFCQFVTDLHVNDNWEISGKFECELFFKQEQDENEEHILYGLFGEDNAENALTSEKSVDVVHIFAHGPLEFKLPTYYVSYNFELPHLQLLSGECNLILAILQERFNMLELQRNLGRWIRNNAAFNEFVEVIHNGEEQTRSDVAMEENIEESILFQCANNKNMFASIDCKNIFESDEVLELKLLLKTLPDELYFDEVVYHLRELKGELSEWLSNILEVFVKEIVHHTISFNNIIAKESAELEETVRKYQYCPEKFGYLLQTESILGNNSFTKMLNEMYMQMCEFWRDLNWNVSLIFDDKYPYEKTVYLSVELILRQVRLVAGIRSVLESIQAKIPDFCFFIENVDAWLGIEAYKLQTRIKEIMGITFSDFLLAEHDALTFEEKFPDICSNYEFPLIELSGDKHNNNHEEEFLASLAKYTMLPLKSVRYNFAQVQAQLQSRATKYSNGKEGIGLYERDKITFKKNTISVLLILQETCYITSQLYELYRTIHLWRRMLQQLIVSSSTDQDITEPQGIYPSFLEMNNAISALAVLLQYDKELSATLTKRQLSEFDDAYAVECLDMLSQAIVTLRSRSGVPHPVHNSLYDFYKIGIVKPRDDFVSFTISYDAWEETIRQIENAIIDRIETVYLAFLVKNVKLTEVAEAKLLEEMEPVERDNKAIVDNSCHTSLPTLSFITLENCSIDELLKTYKRTPEILDQLLLRYQEQTLEDIAIREMKTMLKQLMSYVCKAPVQLGTESNAVEAILITPTNFDAFFHEAMKSLQAILNNTYLQLSRTCELQRYNEIVINEIYQAHTEAMYKRPMYSTRVHLFARDLEAALQACKKLFTHIKRLPLILRDLRLVLENGTIISVSRRKDGFEHTLGLFLESEVAQIRQALELWEDILKYNFPTKVSLYTLTQNQQLAEDLMLALSLVDEAHNQLYTGRYTQIIRLLTSQYNRMRNAEEPSFQLRTTYNTAFGQSTAEVDFIPLHDTDILTDTLLFPSHVELLFSEADFINQALETGEVRNEVFCGYKSFLIEDDAITSVETDFEELKLETPIPTHEPLIFAVYQVKKQITSALKEQCKAACAEFKRIYSEYRQLVINCVDASTRTLILFPFLQKYSYEVINIAFSTVFRAVYTRFLFAAFMQKEGEKLLPEITIQGDVKLCIEQQNHGKWNVLDHRLEEWNRIFKDIETLAGEYSGDKLLAKLDTFPLLYYDHKNESVMTVFNHGGFSLHTRDQYMAECASDYVLSAEDMGIMVKILQCLQEHTTIVFTGNEAGQYRNPNLDHFVKALQNYQETRTVYVVVSERSFASCIKRICALLINGINVVIFGAELLSHSLCTELVTLIQLTQRGDGVIPSFVSCFEKQDVGEEEADFSSDLEFVEESYTTTYANLSEFQSCGQPILFLPVLELCENPEDNVDHYVTPSINLLHAHKNHEMIELEFQSLYDEYQTASPLFAKQFYTLAVSLSIFNDDYPKFSSDMIELIMSKVQNKADSLSVAVMTIDLLLHETVELYFDGDGVEIAKQLSNIVASAFGLQKQEEKQLFRVAAHYCGYISDRLFGRDANDPAMVQSFEDYFGEQLQQYANQMYLFYIEVFSKVEFLPVQMLYDVLYVNDLFKFRKPVLAISPESEYSRIFLSMLAAIKDWDYDYVVDRESLELVLYQSYNKLKRQHLIGVECTSLAQFSGIFEHIIGFNLQHPVVPTEFNEMLYYDSPDAAPYVICFVNTEIAKELRTSRYYRLFRYKLILSPVVENSIGVREIIQAPLHNAFISLTKFLKTLGCSEELCAILEANKLLTEQIQYSELLGPPIETVLRQVGNYSGNFPETEIALRLSHMYINFMHRSIEQLREHETKIYCVKYFAAGIIQFFFEQISQIYRDSYNVQEIMLLRSTMYFFMTRMGLMRRRHGTVELMRELVVDKSATDRLLDLSYLLQTDENAQYLNGIGAVDTISDTLSPNNTLYVQEARLLSDISGFFSKDIQEYNKYARSLGNQQIDKMIGNSVDHFSFVEEESLGAGYTDNFSYQFNYEFFARHLLSENNLIVAYRNIALPIIASIWNACYLLATVTKNRPTERETQYLKFTALFKMLLFKQNSFYTHLLQPFAYIIAMQEKVPGINPTSIRYMTEYSRSTIIDLKMNIEPEYVASCIHRLHTLIVEVLPDTYKASPFYYLMIDKQRTLVLENCEYKFGEGILEHIKDNSEAELLKAMKQDYDLTKKEEQDMYSARALIARKYNFGNKTKTFSPFSVFQHIDTEGTLFFDGERIAYCCLLAAAMLAPVSTAVVGNRADGKSSLINAARLIVENDVASRQVFLSSFRNRGDVAELIRAITMHYNRKTIKSRDDKNYIIFDQSNDHGYPSFHIQASECIGDEIDDTLALLVRDHIIKFDMADRKPFYGCYSLSDSSLIVELQHGSALEKHCGLVLPVPRINESYICNYLSYIFAEADQDSLNEYIRGFFMIEESLPPEICDNYILIQKMIENTKYLIENGQKGLDDGLFQILDGYSNQRNTDEMQQTDQILKHSKDYMLMQPNMHELFYALRQVGCVNNIVMQVIAERISSLTLLGYMKSGNASPWGDSEIVETGRFMFYNGWESFLINNCVKPTNLDNIEINSEFIRDQMSKQSVLLPVKIATLPDDDVDLLEVIKSFTINRFWFGHVIEIVKQLKNYDPLLLSKSIEVFIQMFSRREQVVSFFNTLHKYGIEYLMDDIGDGLMPARLHMVADYSARAPGEEQMSHLPLVLSYALEPVQYYVNLQDSTIQNYNQIIHYLELFSEYQKAETDEPPGSEIVIDLRSLANVAEADTSKIEVGDVASGSLRSELHAYFVIVEKVVKAPLNLQSLVLITVLRIVIGMALGIKPSAFLTTDNLSNMTASFHPTSIFEKEQQASSIPGGLNISEIPISQASHERLANNEMYERQYEQDIMKDYTMYLEEPSDIILVAPKSLMLLENDSKTTLMQLLEYNLTPLNQNYGLLSPTETCCLCRIIAGFYQLEYLLEPHELSIFLARRLCFLMINDDCAGKNFANGQFVDNQITYNIQNIRSLGTIKSPIVEFLENIQQFQSSVVRDEYHEREHQIQAVEIAPPEPPVRITDTRLIELQNKCVQYRYNIIELNLSDLVTLFNISNCLLPRKFTFPDAISYDYNAYVHDYTLGTLECYEFFTTLANGPTVSLPQFTRLASGIANLILESCQNFFLKLSNIFLAYRFYQIMSGARARQIALDFANFGLEELKLFVRESTMQSINGKDIELTDNNTEAVMEYMILREYFLHIIDSLKGDFQEYSGAVASSHFDAICIACYTTFYSTGLITDEETEQTLANLPTQDNNLKEQRIINESFGDKNICQFNLLVISRLLQCGFRVAYPLEKDESGFVTLGKNAIERDRQLFISHFLDTCNNDWPLFLILNSLRIPWSVNDPEYYILATAALYFVTNTSIFFVDDALAGALAVLIEALKKERQFSNNFCNETREALNHGVNYAEGDVLVGELQKRVVSVDICMEPYEFETQFARALGTEDCSILVKNFGMSGPNVETLRSFLDLKLSGSIGRRAMVKIGRIYATTNNALEAYTVIFALGPKCKIGQALKSASLLTQNVLDNAYMGCCYNEDDNHCNCNENQVVSQLIISACFGASSSARSLRECIRTYNQAEHYALAKASDRTFHFVRRKLLGKQQEGDVKSIGINELWEIISRLHIELKKLKNLIEYSSVLNDNQEDDLISLFQAYQNLEFEEQGKSYLLDEAEPYVKRGSLQQLECQHFKFMNKQGAGLIDSISTAIIRTQELLNSMGNLQTSLCFVMSTEQLECLRVYLDEQLHIKKTLEKDESEQYLDEANEGPKLKEFDLEEINPMSYEIIFNSENAIRLISRHTLQFMDQNIRRLCPANLANEVAQYLCFLFLSQMQFIRFKYDNIIQTDFLKGQSKKENQEFLLLKHILSFSFDDYISLISGAQVINIMYKTSKFSLISHNVKNQQMITKISDIYPCLPDICKLASNMAFCWLGLSHLALTDEYIETSLSWFISHTSTLISLTDSAEPFVSCMLYYQNNGISQQTRFKKGIHELFRRYPETQAISQLPVAFQKLNDASIFSLLLISIVVKPTILAELLDQYNVVMDELFNAIAASTNEKGCEKHYLIPATNRALESLNEMSGNIQLEEGAEFDLLCDSLQSVCCVIEENQATSAFLVYFYDRGCEMQSLTSYLIDYVFQSACPVSYQFEEAAYRKNECVFVLELEEISLEELKQMCALAHESLLSSNRQHLPVVILVQNEGKLGDYMLGNDPLWEENFESESLSILRRALGVRFHYCERPQTLSQCYLYNLDLALATLHAASKAEKKDTTPIASYRGFSLLILRQSLRLMYRSIQCADSECSNRISHVYSVSTSKLVKQRLDVLNSDFAQVLRCDEVYFSDQCLPESLLERHIDHLVQKILEGSEAANDAVEMRYITKEKSSQTKANASQLKQAYNSSDEESGADIIDTTLTTQTTRFNQQSKALTNLISSGGKIKSAQLANNKITRREDDPLQLIATNMAQTDQRLDEIEEFFPGRFRSSVRKYFAADRDIIEEKIEQSDIFKSYPTSIPTLIDLFRLIKAVKCADCAEEDDGDHDQSATMEGSGNTKEECPAADAPSIRESESARDVMYMRLTHHEAQRYVFSAPFSQKLFSEAQFKSTAQKVAQIPNSIREFITKIEGFEMLKFKNRLSNAALQDLVLDQLICQEGNYFGAESMLSRFGNCYLINCCIFQPILGKVLNYIRIRNSLKTGTSLSQQQLLFSVEKPKKQAIINKNQEVVDLESRPDTILQMRGFELIGAAYDNLLGTVCDETPETQSGFGNLLDIYVISCTCEGESVKQRNGFVNIPIFLKGYCQGFVQLRNKTSLPGSEWERRGISFCVRKQ